jgi:group I intron endonuclease
MRKCFRVAFPRVLGNLPVSHAIRYWVGLVGSGSVVYVLTCLLSGEQYVGQTGNLNGREVVHIRQLLNGSHHSKGMLRAFDSYGIDAFTIDILENCDGRSKEYRKAREEYYIAVLRPAFNS